MRSTARPDDTTKGPAIYKSAGTRAEPVEGQIIIEIRIEVMADIEGGVSPLQAQAVGLRRCSRIVVATESSDIIDGMRPCVMQIKLKATAQRTTKVCLQGVVMGMTARTSQ